MVNKYFCKSCCNETHFITVAEYTENTTNSVVSEISVDGDGNLIEVRDRLDESYIDSEIDNDSIDFQEEVRCANCKKIVTMLSQEDIKKELLIRDDKKKQTLSTLSCIMSDCELDCLQEKGIKIDDI